MSEPNASGPHGVDIPGEPDEIQFDQAEYAPSVPSGPTCGVCQRAIADEYYEINGKVCCASCRQGVEATLRGGSRVARFLKAFLLGSMAAAVGAVIYYVILRTTGYNIGLVAVVVGAIVGGAVRKGTGNRGSRFYQLLAVFLTYSAIVAMYIPFLFEGFAKAKDEAEQAKVVAAKGEKDPAQANARPQAPAIATKEPSRPAAGDQPGSATDPKAPAKDSAQVPVEKIAEAKIEPGVADEAVPPITNPAAILLTVLIGLAFLIGILYTVPIQLAIGDPLSGLIFGFALWEAWKMNKRVTWSFNGPFRVSAQGSDALTPKVDEDGG